MLDDGVFPPFAVEDGVVVDDDVVLLLLVLAVGVGLLLLLSLLALDALLWRG